MAQFLYLLRFDTTIISLSFSIETRAKVTATSYQVHLTCVTNVTRVNNVFTPLPTKAY